MIDPTTKGLIAYFVILMLSLGAVYYFSEFY